MSNSINIGEMIKGTEHRDAVHVAIAPVIAGEDIKPGDHIGFETGKCDVVHKSSDQVEPIGIADPFLRRSIPKGACFWLLLYPNTVTSLRHEWAHPAFRTSDEISLSEAYLRNFAKEQETPYSDLLDGAFDGDNEIRFDLPGEFWYHFEKVTGKHVELEERRYFFRCYC